MNILYNSGNLVHSNDNEKLYLNDKGVSVNNYLLEQHQVEALRFLFEQFDKKSPGAVVNFPQSCGKAHTVAIFLNAVSNKLKDPVLILCKDISEMKYWKEILNKCSSYIDDEIAIDFYNPYTKMKKVFLKSKEIPPSYTQRHWSVVIIKHNTQMFKFPVTADFKIFICSTDLKKDYAMLSHVHTWLYPKRKNDDKAAESEKIIEKADASVQDDRKRHIKNKDPTGTKIKKSRLVSDDDTVLNTTTKPNVVSANNETRSNNENAISINDQMENKVSDKSQIKEESTEPLEFDNASNVNLNEIKDLRKQLFESLGFESESLLENNNSNVMLEEHTFSSVHFDDNVEKEDSTESLCFNSGSNVDVPNDLQNKNILQKNLLESLGLNRDKVEINKKISVGQNEVLLQKQPIESCPEDMQVEIKKELNDDLNKEAQSFSLGLGDEKGEIRKELSDDQNKKMLQKKLIESLGLTPDDVQFEMNKEISISDDQNRKMLQKQLIDSLGLDEEDGNDEIKKESNDDQNMNEEETLEIKIEPDCDTKTKENVNSVGGNKSGESDKDLDLKISLMEERALEKFKGSLLDSLF
ncbi:uncharacterized protein DDB_G0288805 isoform X2 [Bicyclus anynana]|uniref:Uncharacterized protein DDB_G0288805 isoform X2 n=1 Tax=Bicyclus anynana TaxID=110368 RepID=A0ABM3LN16_BICAN|nr:uncharacterized protein DDB_G0288805 isoform X2 [Bicyclus anynana]